MSIYIASPFFNAFEVTVRDLMCKHLDMVLPNEKHLRPDLTSASKSYAVSEGQDRKERAREIFRENINMINSCDILCFPRFTDDIGTLFEVGYAMSQHKVIKRFNYLSMKIEDVSYELPESIWWEPNVRISGVTSAVKFGLFYGMRPDHQLTFTMRPGIKPNVMFSSSFTEVDDQGNIVEQNWEEVR